MRWDLTLIGLAILTVLAVVSGCGSSNAPKSPPRKNEPGFSVSPDGSHAAFLANDQNLYLLDIASGAVIQVTQKPQASMTPIFLGDGKRILYVTDDDPGGVHIAITGMDGARLKSFEFAGTIGGLTIAPDGKHAAYIAHSGSCSHIAAIDLDSGAIKDLTTPGKTGDVSPVFFPDSSKLLFVRGTTHSERNFVAGAGWHNNELFAVGIDGTGLTQISANDFVDNHFFPIFADNGKRAFFTIYDTSDPSVKDSKMSTLLYSIATDGSEKKPARIAVAGSPKPYDGADYCTILSTSADGSRILFMSDRAESYAYNYWVMNPDGSAPVQLSFDTVKDIQTKKHGHMRQPVISADGKRVYYFDHFTDSLMQIDTDGKNAKPVGRPGLFANPIK